MKSKRINQNSTSSRDQERDMFGTPKNRAKTWGGSFNCIKRDRRNSKKELRT